jgi:hypothetical protein
LISEGAKVGLALAKSRGTRLGNSKPATSLLKASQSIQERKSLFIVQTRKIIQEIQSAGVSSLSKIADCLNKRGEKTRRGGLYGQQLL